MNDARRRRIAAIQTKLSDLKAEIEAIQAEEQDAYDNLPAGLQESENGNQIGLNADHLQEAADAVDEVVTSLEEAAR